MEESAEVVLHSLIINSSRVVFKDRRMGSIMCKCEFKRPGSKTKSSEKQTTKTETNKQNPHTFLRLSCLPLRMSLKPSAL